MDLSAPPKIPYLRLLLGLKAKLLWRNYTRNTSAVVGAIVLIVFLGPFSLFLGWGGLTLFRELAPAVDAHLLRGVMLGAYLFWLLSPLLGYALTEDYDIGKLLLYPITARQVLTGAIAGSMMDFGVLFLLPVMLAVVISFSSSLLAFILSLVAVAVFLFHTVSLSQAISLVGAGILRSRRARDLMMVLIPLISIGFYLTMQMLPRYAMSQPGWNPEKFLRSPGWQAVGVLPPGIAANAIAGAAGGQYGVAFAWLAALLVIAATTLYLTGHLVQLVYTGAVISAPVRPRKERAPRRQAAPAAERQTVFGARLPPVVEAIVDKEFKYLVRDPTFKFILLQCCYMLVLMVFMLRPWHGQGPGFPGRIWFVGPVFFMMQSSLVFNIFGMEGFAAPTLFLFPSPRKLIVVGKNLAHFLALTMLNLAAAFALSVAAKQPHMAPLLTTALILGTVVMIATGNLVSVYCPYRFVMRGWRLQQHSASQGCTQQLMRVVVTLVAGLFALPALAAVIVPTYWISPIWLALTLPLAIGYAAACYLVSLRLAEAALLQREIEVAETLGKE